MESSSATAAFPCLIAEPEMALEATPGVGRPIQVLHIEDNAEAAELVQIYLTEKEANAFRVEWACNLIEAMTRLAQPGVDVVLLDLGLPELSSYKSYCAIDIAAGPTLPVVILTSDDRRVSRDLTLSFGASDYLLKQESTPERLKQALRNAVTHSRPAHCGDLRKFI